MANVKIVSMRTRGVTGMVKAYFTLSLGAIEIEDMKLIDGRNGVFVGFPVKKISKEGEADRYLNLVRMAKGSDKKFTESAQKLYDEILNTALAEYERRAGEALAAAPAATPEDNGEDDLPF